MKLLKGVHQERLADPIDRLVVAPRWAHNFESRDIMRAEDIDPRRRRLGNESLKCLRGRNVGRQAVVGGVVERGKCVEVDVLKVMGANVFRSLLYALSPIDTRIVQ